LTGGLMYKKVAPSGEIQYGSPGEVVYHNQADTYGLVLGIARTDLINDDMNALSSAAFRLGRGGALKVNDVFWTIFLNNSTFFTAGNANVITGAGSALSLTALGSADRAFRVQTDPDGFPIGIMPRKLVVPTTLRISALNIVNSTFVVATNTAQTAVLSPQTNVLQGTYDVVSSPYMENASYTGNSNAAWYLLADPADMPVIEVCFLNGVQQPTVETADADFNQLGIAMRGVHDFGVSMQEYRGGVRSAGA
jgi:phage major head subunit gpT-like protein